MLARILGAAVVLVQCAAAPAATFVVDTTENSNAAIYKFCDAADDGDCSFHGALERANATPEADTIAFNIPASLDSGCVAATGVCRILLPNTGCSNFTDSFVVTQPVVIDGLTQPGASANTLPAGSAGLDMQIKIELARTSFCKSGLRFLRSATVKNVAITQFGSVGNQTLPFLNFAGSDNASEVFRVESSIIGRNADGGSDQGDNGFIGNPIRIGDCFQCLGSWRNEVHIGGELPAQRNWFVGGGPAIRIEARSVSPTLLGTEVFIQGNLFGTNKSGLAAGFESTPGENWVELSLGNDVRVQVGGNAAAARNVFSTNIYPAIGPPPMALPSYTTGTPTLFVQGNHFGLGVDGVTPLRVRSAVYEVGGRALAVSRAQVGGTGPGEANMFVALYPSVVIDSLGANTILANQFIGNITINMIQDAARQSGILNDAGDSDQFPNAGPKQNWPEISAFSVVGNDLSVTYRVDSLPANSTYPLTVEFFAADTNNATRLLGRDTCTAAEATGAKTVVLPQPANHGLSSDSMIIATVNMADNGGVSSFSWAPVFLTFQGNTPATVNQPASIRVRLQGVGPFRPSGRVEISDQVGSPTAQKCIATLTPVANSPYRAEGTCTITWQQVGSRTLTATYLDLHESFHSDAGATPTNTRPIDIIAAPASVELLCDGFETPSRCSSPR